MATSFEIEDFEIDLTTPPTSDVEALAAVVADLGRWICELEDRIATMEALLP